MRLGDAANCVMLVNTLAFLVYVLEDSLGNIPKPWGASPSFRRAGFCVANEETPLSQSHMLCFYVDSFTTVVLLLLGRCFGSREGVKGSAVLSAAPGIFGHGLAHLGLWAGQLPAEGEALVVDRAALFASPLKLALNLAMLWAFFWALLRSLPSVSNRAAAAHAAIHSPILTFFTPARLQFTYVQTALLAVAAAHELLLRRDKDYYYDVAAVAINLPVGFVAWFEALACDSFLGQSALTYKAAGGHVLYDGTICCSMFAYYAIVLSLPAMRDKQS
eukprot:CAMPEP_0119369664 /NCGR_PEP_ID=MMETSP1334-20130426/16149_1 /TAXON_ID=127549 /ORGANISM="Calcidiscus leptoporus, Strain RCC1130" /LENGTH=274 /DNA_ID=CAMNT_0007386557 /DNA_START=108 /DNA_END=932 /DNA_ORIENTATION=+